MPKSKGKLETAPRTPKPRRGRPKSGEGLSPHTKVEMCLMRFRPLEKGNAPLSYQSVADRFSTTAKVVERAIQEAFKEHWVVLRPGLVAPKYTFDEGLRDRLAGALERHQFSARPKLLVVREADFHPLDPHVQVGHALAGEFHQTKPRSKDAIFVSSGRSVQFTLQSLQAREPREIDDISIISLSGSVITQRRALERRPSQVAPIDLGLESDQHAAMLATTFVGTVHVYAMHSSIAAESQEKDRFLRQNAGLEALEEARPGRYMLAGGNAFSADHRLFKAAAEGIIENAAFRDDVLALGRKLAAIERDHPGYDPVFGIVNTMLLVPPPKEIAARLRGAIGVDSSRQSPLDPQKCSIAELVARINMRTVAPPLDKLLGLECFVAAATEKKARGILHVLRTLPRLISTLVLDSGAASRMLRLLMEEES
ncbi:MAG: hypothetical protein ABUL73_02000 [Alphaproteobacteria bacterium]